jgi:RNA polymerase sigma-70 factor (ECF subfamily)
MELGLAVGAVGLRFETGGISMRSGLKVHTSSPDHDERRTIALASGGDRSAFRCLYDRYSSTVFTYLVYATPSIQDAEELTQDVFISVWRKLHQFRSESRFSTWLMSIAVTTAKMWARRRSPTLIPFDDGVSSPRASDPFGAADLLDLRGAICKLPPRARMVLVLHELTNHSHEEIAGIMGTSVGASKAQLNRAKRLLRERMTYDR